MALFLGLYLGHILGDFVFQPGRLVIAKREHLTAAVLHTLIVTACTSLSLAAVLPTAWPAVLIAGVAHLGVEQLSIGARRDPSARSLAVFLLDQALHIMSLAVIAMLARISVEPVVALWAVPMATLAALCAVATVAFGGSILVFEVQKATADRDAKARAVLRLDFGRLYGMVERGGALVSALLLPLPPLGALAFVPRVAYAVFSDRGSRNSHFIAAAVGIGLTVVGWGLVSSVGAH